MSTPATSEHMPQPLTIARQVSTQLTYHKGWKAELT